MNSADKVILKHRIEVVLNKGMSERARAFDMGYIIGYATASTNIDFDMFAQVALACSAFNRNDYDDLKRALSALL